MDIGMPVLIELPSLEDNLILCSRLGLSFLELNMNLPCCQLSALADTDTLLAMSRRYGCYYTIHLDEDLDPFCFNPLVAQAWLQTALAAADAAAALDAPVINMHLCRGVYFTLPDHKEFLYRTHRSSYLSSVRRFCDELSARLQNSRTIVCIENTNGFTDFQLEAIELLLESDRFALTWDIGHSFCAGEADMDYILNTHGDRLYHMHFHDAAGNSAHLPLGAGELPLSERLECAAQHNCRCVIEVKTAESLAHSVGYLRKELI